MNRTLLFLSWCTLLSALGIVLLIMFWLFYPYHVIDFKYDKLPILNKRITNGDTLLWQGDHVHYTDGVPVKVSRQIICNTLTNLPDSSYISKRGHFQSVNSSVIIPNGLEGECHIKIVSQWAINPLRTIIIEKETENFTIIP